MLVPVDTLPGGFGRPKDDRARCRLGSFGDLEEDREGRRSDWTPTYTPVSVSTKRLVAVVIAVHQNAGGNGGNCLPNYRWQW